MPARTALTGTTVARRGDEIASALLRVRGRVAVDALPSVASPHSDVEYEAGAGHQRERAFPRVARAGEPSRHLLRRRDSSARSAGHPLFTLPAPSGTLRWTPSTRGRKMRLPNEQAGWNIQRARQCQKNAHAQVRGTTFDPLEIAEVLSRTLCKRFLRQTPTSPSTPHVGGDRTKESRQLRIVHLRFGTPIYFAK